MRKLALIGFLALSLCFPSMSGHASEGEGAQGEGEASAEGDEAYEPGLADRPLVPRMGMDLLYSEEGVSGQGGAGAGFGKVGEDLFVTLNLSMVISGEDWAIAPRVPLRFCVVDNAPESSSVIRTEDWDEISDFARLVAFAQYGRLGDSFYVRFGEFSGASVGHGTLVNQYYNTLDIDHYQAGIVTALDLGIVGGEILLDNVFDPEVLVARPYARPFHYFSSWPGMFRNLKIGVTVGGDFQAPASLQRPAGPAVTGLGAGVVSDLAPGQAGRDYAVGSVLGAANGLQSSEGAIVQGSANQAGVERRLPIPFLGFDLEIPFLNLDSVAVVPYFDLNSIDMLGLGIHFGSFVTVQFSSLVDWRTRLEYRLSGGGYEPAYVDAFYEIHRVLYRDGLPKIGWLRSESKRSRTGFLVESELRILGTLRFTMAVAHDEGGDGQPPSNDLLIRTRLPELGPVSVSAYFARLDFHRFDEMFELDNSVFVLNVRYDVMDYMYVQGRVVNEWWLRHDPGGQGQSSYETTTDFDIGVGFLIDL